MKVLRDEHGLGIGFSWGETIYLTGEKANCLPVTEEHLDEGVRDRLIARGVKFKPAPDGPLDLGVGSHRVH